uniref:ACB domain-containing protein n=1 Tax=Chrysotila carterae TaxID=13221 RepID=A0A7S4B229_CHRCT|mmetsp:Transcript_21775/g.47614  ORF Transcript_21775/g.47614 Transcript_21775/m.47614 type:complete len:112 (-) Transcript_21775:287-622(-)
MPCKPFPFKINAGDPFRICSCAALSPASRYKLVPFFLGTQIVSDDDKLAAYRWFKQATVGDIDIPQPKILDFNWAARQKWKAWKTAEGTNKETAMQNYLAEMKRQRQKYGE